MTVVEAHTLIMQSELPFEGFRELIQLPLEKADPKSYNKIRRIFLDVTVSHPNPFSLLIQKLSNRSLPNKDAVVHWRRLLEHKQWLESKLGRLINIQAAAIDYFDQPDNDSIQRLTESLPTLEQKKVISEASTEKAIDNALTPGFHYEKLKEEILRARRYKHALSSILLDIDDFSEINEKVSYSTGDQILSLIVKITQKTIRNVDFLSRHSSDRFLLILPNTNKREAMELAERLRKNVFQRTKRIEGIPEGVTITLSVGQVQKDDSAIEFIKKLETLLQDGKRKGKNTVYQMS